MDATVAKALALPARGAAYSAVTIGCKASVQPVAVSDWKLGEATLPAKTIVSAKTVFVGATLKTASRSAGCSVPTCSRALGR